ncbi:MAG: hypothetical protein WA628_10790 [Terriglobales bacterium]
MTVTDTLQQTLGEGTWAVQRGTLPGKGFVNCEICRAEMSTDGLLAKLRCAECRQLSLDRAYDGALKLGLTVCAASMLLCLLTRWAKQA